VTNAAPGCPQTAGEGPVGRDDLPHERVGLQSKSDEVDRQDGLPVDGEGVAPQVVRTHGQSEPVLRPVDLDHEGAVPPPHIQVDPAGDPAADDLSLGCG
jgi:hypothetical protein